MQFPFLLIKHLLVLLWWKHTQQFQGGWLHFTTTNKAVHSIRPLETTNDNSDTYWCVFSGEVGGLGFSTWACICKPHTQSMFGYWQFKEQLESTTTSTLSPLWNRNVAWRASLWLCWMAGSGLQEQTFIKVWAYEMVLIHLIVYSGYIQKFPS